MRIDSPGLVTDLDLLRLQGGAVIDHGDHLVVRTESNPTFWWGNFVLVPTAARSDEVDRWTARFEEEFPDAHHRAIGFALPGGDTEAWAASGWDVEGDVDLATTSVPRAADAPDGLQLRQLETDDDWEQSAGGRWRRHPGGAPRQPPRLRAPTGRCPARPRRVRTCPVVRGVRR